MSDKFFGSVEVSITDKDGNIKTTSRKFHNQDEMNNFLNSEENKYLDLISKKYNSFADSLFHTLFNEDRISKMKGLLFQEKDSNLSHQSNGKNNEKLIDLSFYQSELEKAKNNKENEERNNILLKINKLNNYKKEFETLGRDDLVKAVSDDIAKLESSLPNNK